MTADYHFWTVNPDERNNLGWQEIVDETGFWSPTTALQNTLPVYRSFNPVRSVHHWSTDRNEYPDDGFRPEGEAYRVFSSGSKHTVALERWIMKDRFVLKPQPGAPVYFFTPNRGKELLDRYDFDKVVGYVYEDGLPDEKLKKNCRYVYRYNNSRQ